MIFNQFEFVFIFLPAIVLAFYMPGMARARSCVLLMASLVFYGLSGLEHAVVLTIEVLWVYGLTRSPRIVANASLLTLAVLPPAAALIYYKYLGFLVRSVLGLDVQSTQAFQLFSSTLLPAGISFYTFNLVSYAIDRYRGEIPKPPPLSRFALFITFFPHLVAGPILRFRDVADALARLRTFRLEAGDAEAAVGYGCMGLALKVLVADTLGRAVDVLAATPGELTPAAAAYVIGAYSFQIYFDFYGYSLCAIGLARLFGVHFPRNFARPYEARNPRDFWRRWHMTLSYWIRDYLYLPLGGNQRYVRNIIIVFALCGLWHGAGWNFVVWGLYHGLLVVAYHVWGERTWNRMPAILQQAGTFALVSVGWTLFLFDFSNAALLFSSLFGDAAAPLPGPQAQDWLVLAVAAAVCFGVNPEAIADDWPGTITRTHLRMAGLAVLFVAAVLFFDRSQSFIYFRF